MGNVNRPESIWDIVKDLVRRVGNLETKRTNPLAPANGTADVVITTTGAFRVHADAGTFIDHVTTANAANAVIGTNGRIRRSTSSRRWKTHIRDADIDPDMILALAPRRFTSTLDGDEHVGVIAEEAAALGLTDWVGHDEEGPESFDYAGFSIALLAVCRAQQEQLDQLTVRLDALVASLGPTMGKTTEGPDHG